MATIALTKGMVAHIDEIDLVIVGAYKWYAQLAKNTIYAARRDSDRNLIYMHRQIANATPNDQVDHRDHDGLNNRRDNLRVCLITQNHANRRKGAKRTSAYKGVYWNQQKKMWHAQITQHRKRHHLGFYDVELDAANAYNAAATTRFGVFALLNEAL